MFPAAVLVGFQLKTDNRSEKNLVKRCVSRLLMTLVARMLTAAMMIKAGLVLAILLRWAGTVR
jgi:hypothetical protein